MVSLSAGVPLRTSLLHLLPEAFKSQALPTSLFTALLAGAFSGFVYLALADLLPQLQQRVNWRETLGQISWPGAGWCWWR